MEASIGLAGEDEAMIPETKGALASHPFFRLGPQYDASLKDINVLMVSGSTQTGPSSRLSSVAAPHFTYAAQLGDIYERQLGLRYRLQEMVLIASDSGQDDVKYDVEYMMTRLYPTTKMMGLTTLAQVRQNPRL